KARIEGLPGIAARVSPDTFSVGDGETQELTLSFAVVGSSFDQYSIGAVVLSREGDDQQLRLPVSLRPVRVAAPRLVAVDSPQTQGAVAIPLRAGFTGQIAASGVGLATGVTRPAMTVGRQRVEPAPDPGIGTLFDLTVPPGAAFLAGATSNVDDGDPKTDLDLYLFRDEAGDGFQPEDLVARSARGSAEEDIQIVAPEPGAYRFTVVGFTTRDPESVFDFTTWLLDDPSPNDQSPAPGFAVGGDTVEVIAGEAFSLEASWSGLPDGVTGYGLVTYRDTSDPTATPVATTLVRIGPGPSEAASPAPERRGRGGPES
ncbi:MAG: PPC domain-containing protein, partial [Acidimicrobiia bacterium]